VPLREAAPQLNDSAHPDYLSLTPARHDTDGFFAAVMQRDGAEANVIPDARSASGKPGVATEVGVVSLRLLNHWSIFERSGCRFA